MGKAPRKPPSAKGASTSAVLPPWLAIIAVVTAVAAALFFHQVGGNRTDAPNAATKSAVIPPPNTIASCLMDTSLHAEPCTETGVLIRYQMPMPQSLFFAAEDLEFVLFEKALRVGGTLDQRDRLGRSPVARMAMVGQSYVTKIVKFLLFTNGLALTHHEFNGVLDLWPCIPLGLRAWHRHFVGSSSSAPPFDGRIGYNDVAAALAPAQLAIATAYAHAGGDLNSADALGLTVLHHAAMNGLTELVEGLLKLGADPNARDRYGRTPLMVAAARHRDRAVAILLGADAPPPLLPGSVPFPEPMLSTLDAQNGDGGGARAILARQTHMGHGPWAILPADGASAAAGASPPIVPYDLSASLRATLDRGPRGGWPYVLSERSVDELTAHGDSCTRVSAKELSSGQFDFSQLFGATSSPIVIVDAMDGWDLSVYEKEYLEQVRESRPSKLGGIPYPETVEADASKLHAQQLTMAQFAKQRMAKAGRTNEVQNGGVEPPPVYYFRQLPWNEMEAELPQLMPPLPRFLTAIPGFMGLTWQIILGPTGSGAPEHFHFDAVNFLVHGTKQWWLTPPDVAGFSKVHPTIALRDDPPKGLHVGPKTIKCVQHPGEAIYVPSGWGHAVRNHGDSFALATEYSASGSAADMSMTERLKSAEMRGYARPPWSMDKPLLR